MVRGSGQDQISSRPKKANGKGRWTLEEHGRFLEGVRLYGKNWDAIGVLVPTRSVMQIRTHYSPKYAARKQNGLAPHDEACDTNTMRSGLSAEPQCCVSKPVAASNLPVSLPAPSVQRAGFQAPSASIHARTAHGIYAGLNSTTRTQELGSGIMGDKPRTMASHSDAANSLPAPDKYHRPASRSHALAPLTPTFTEAAAAHRYGYGSPTTMPAIRTPSTVYGDRSSAYAVDRTNADAGYGMSRRVADEDSSGMSRSSADAGCSMPPSSADAGYEMSRGRADAGYGMSRGRADSGYGVSRRLADKDSSEMSTSRADAGYGMSRTSADAGYETSRRVADEDRSRMSTSLRRPTGLPSESWGGGKAGCLPRMTADTEEADGIVECFCAADIFGVL